LEDKGETEGGQSRLNNKKWGGRGEVSGSDHGIATGAYGPPIEGRGKIGEKNIKDNEIDPRKKPKVYEGNVQIPLKRIEITKEAEAVEGEEDGLEELRRRE